MSYVKEADLRTAYELLNTATEELAQAKLDLHEAKNSLDITKAAATINGLEGKNQAERDANLKSVLAPDLDEVEQIEKTVIKRQRDYDIARRNVYLCQDLMRLAELELKEAGDE